MPIIYPDVLDPAGTTFPIVRDINVAGGLHVVADQTEREGIAELKQKAGMLCFQQDVNLVYRLTTVAAPPNTNWVVFPDSTEAKGGFRVVADQTEREAIPQDQQVVGMWAYQVDTSAVYKLDTVAAVPNSNWTEVPFGGWRVASGSPDTTALATISNPAAGQIGYVTDTNQAYVRVGSTWEALFGRAKSGLNQRFILLPDSGNNQGTELLFKSTDGFGSPGDEGFVRFGGGQSFSIGSSDGSMDFYANNAQKGRLNSNGNWRMAAPGGAGSGVSIGALSGTALQDNTSEAVAGDQNGLNVRGSVDNGYVAGFENSHADGNTVLIRGNNTSTNRILNIETTGGTQILRVYGNGEVQTDNLVARNITGPPEFVYWSHSYNTQEIQVISPALTQTKISLQLPDNSAIYDSSATAIIELITTGGVPSTTVNAFIVRRQIKTTQFAGAALGSDTIFSFNGTRSATAGQVTTLHIPFVGTNIMREIDNANYQYWIYVTTTNSGLIPHAAIVRYKKRSALDNLRTTAA